MFFHCIALPPFNPMIAHQQPEAIQRVLPPFSLILPPPRSTAELLYGPPPTDLPRFFRECDDDRLQAIMSDYPSRLSRAQWSEVATTFGGGVTVRQIQERWHNFVRPGLDRSHFSVSERRQVAALAIDQPRQWSLIAKQLGNGKYRSAAMVKHCAMNILPKLQSLGFRVEKSADIELLPDAVFERGFPKGTAGRKLVAEYKAKKAQQAEGGNVKRQVDAIALWNVEALLSKPVTK
jgi:hypothetical protein